MVYSLKSEFLLIADVRERKLELVGRSGSEINELSAEILQALKHISGTLQVVHSFLADPFHHSLP